AMDMTGNKLANVNTNGFKASRPSLADLIYTERNNNNEETQFGHGMRVQKTDMMFEQSQLRSTGRMFDFAALDEGFFACGTPEGITTYTKDGAFYMSPNPAGVWELCNEYGAYILDYDGNRIEIPFLDEESQEIDFPTLTEAIGVYRFDNPYGLDQIGDNYFIATASSGEAQADPLATKKEGYLEASSTSVANEMSKVIEYQRAYQLNINMVKTHDELQGIVNNLRN
ncbi:MAG: flagellar hook-basal body protein, partial [Oscillospiraceae bacterium]|nr:flagellar hook-basal body protein [Oscillospiraceae bacterium]